MAWNTGSVFRSSPRCQLYATAIRIPMTQAGIVTMIICTLVMLKPCSIDMAEKATTAAAIGEHVIPICEAIDAIAQGRSGRMPFFNAMSQIIGIKVYTTCPVPTSTVRKKVVNGAMIVMRSGCFRSIFSAICIIQSIPPDACRIPAQVTAAMMM